MLLSQLQLPRGATLERSRRIKPIDLGVQCAAPVGRGVPDEIHHWPRVHDAGVRETRENTLCESVEESQVKAVARGSIAFQGALGHSALVSDDVVVGHRDDVLLALIHHALPPIEHWGLPQDLCIWAVFVTDKCTYTIGGLRRLFCCSVQ